jgi:hypothetical protein
MGIGRVGLPSNSITSMLRSIIGGFPRCDLENNLAAVIIQR